MNFSETLEELRLLHALTLALDESANLNSALGIVLKEVCRATGWALGEAWLPSPDGAVLNLGPVWHDGSVPLQIFSAASRKYAFPPGVGLPGRVWSSGRPLWVTDVRTDDNFPRFKAARRIGLKAGFAIPVKASGRPIAVVNFFVFEQRREDRRLIALVSAVAEQLGEILQRKVAEEGLKRSRYALEAELKERRRVARELHDGVSQLLSTALFRLRGLEEEQRNPAPRGPQVRPLLEQAIREVRRISLNLGPCILDELGLHAAIRAFALDFENRTRMPVAVSCQALPQALPPPVAWTVYRILQEGFQNIEKHAGATRVRLVIRWLSPWLSATLRDNGSGFAPGNPSSPVGTWHTGLGLRNMRERAQEAGGTLKIRSSAGEGTTLLIRVPWRQRIQATRAPHFKEAGP